jgi:hypothetical protein
MIFALILLAATPTTYAPLFVGRFDPADFPDAQKIERRMPHADLNNRIEKILSERRCSLKGQTKTRFDIVVPYAVLMNAAGKPEKVVVKDIGCAPIETLVGQIGSELANAGDFKLTHSAGTRWYVTEAYFTRISAELAREQEDPDKVICKKDRPKINSRISTVKTCRTVAEWALYEKDREQFKRDFNGAAGYETPTMTCINKAGPGC